MIHISPDNIKTVLSEIYRCSQKYIWGFEYYSEAMNTVTYRGSKDLLWKTDFAKLYCNTYPDLEIEKEEKIKYITNENIDTMFLLKKPD